ncbi:elongation factor P maturation arginine rhamnosyltransferase EarP [Bergeriella denitrificans]|uniref:Protein-arginine rhamnosyltransferase n=1 Tax=Bergeriella denitrificans TaxID=494 RepID=A0A378UFW4_BERDE|nr:elongation factor P maturation arginine rhamnosyltransferase EarP [Bergeriella denitrificans]STZ76050.1 Uncharacterized protein conserved in bacteria [Bergeriella denitrificans]
MAHFSFRQSVCKTRQIFESAAPACWLFCNVIDNFGDIGVSWRLARALSRELGWQVHLWVDDVAALRVICPDLPDVPCLHGGIAVHRWQPLLAEDVADLPDPQIVIETFACELPPNVRSVVRRVRPLWLNWEYLSAEDSHERLHLLPSLQADGSSKYFWFMGFGDKSGGLIRERDYSDGLAAADNLRARLNLPEKSGSEWLLFGYRSAVWARWLDTWRQCGEPLTVYLAGQQIIESLKAAGAIPEDALPEDGAVFQTACVRLVKIPFVAQEDFDRLLSLHDVLMVRGEDSFVRAQLSGKPFFWHIYPQDENVHLDKLHAFWEKAGAFYPPGLLAAHQALSDELNGGTVLDAASRLKNWQTLLAGHDSWRQAAEAWRAFIAAQPSALEKLAKFAQDKLK